jgi:hypothetical protein
MRAGATFPHPSLTLVPPTLLSGPAAEARCSVEGKPKTQNVAAVAQSDNKALMAKYDPLYHHLRRKGLAEFEMSFADVESVVGALLPKSARRPQWWANEASEETSHVQCRA